MKLKNIHSSQDFEAIAKHKLPPFIFDFVNGGAGDESSLYNNESELQNIRLMPQIPDSTMIFNPQIKLFGCDYKVPFGISPIGLISAVYPKAELILADCAKRYGLPFILSAAANVTIKEVKQKTGIPPWFQLYIPKQKAIMERLILTARNHHCPVLVITVDTSVPGIRLRDMRNRLTIPFKPSFTQSLSILNHPQWLLRQITHGKIGFPNFEGLPELEKGHNFRDMMSQQVGGSMSWGTIKKIRELWPNKLILKGIMSQQDAIKAQKIGADAIIISNHGGRQLDKSPSTISALSQLDKTLFDSNYLMLDSGIRSGGDVVSALASGADFLFIGRLFIYALASGGRKHVDHLIEKLTEEFCNTAQLLGCAQASTINNQYLYKNSHASKNTG